MLDQILEEANRVYEVDIVKIAQENDLDTKNVRQFAECFKKAFPNSAKKIDDKLEEGLYFTSNFTDIIVLLLQDNINNYDVIKIHSYRCDALIEIKDSVTEDIDFNFRDEKTEKRLVTNHDKIVYQGNFDIISLRRSAKIPDGVNDLDYYHFLVIRDGLDFSDLRFIPQEVKLVTPVTLNDCIMEGSIIVNENSRIYINGNCEIHGCTDMSSISIRDEMVMFRSNTPDSKLTIYKHPNQACIGTDTHVGMSYGRWSPAQHKEFAIHVMDDLTVECIVDDNFALGCYGNSNNYVPIMCIQEGSKLICPEMTGERIITKQAMAPSGSTKIGESMKYAILKKGQAITDLYTDEDKELIKTLTEYGVKIPEDTLVETKRLKRALKYRARGNELDFSKLFDKNTNIENAASACCLRIPQCYAREEFLWECNKMDYFARAYFGKTGEYAINIVDSLIKHGYERMRTSQYEDINEEYLSEVLWSMIPAYSFNGSWRQPALDVVKEYLDTCNDYKELKPEMIQKFFNDYGF